MGTPRLGPCGNWIDGGDAFACGKCAEIADDARDADLATRMARVASELLYQWTGRRFSGTCDATVRPCRSSGPGMPALLASGSFLGSSSYLAPWGGGYPSFSGWFGGPSGGCSCANTDDCGCGSLSRVTLGGYPVTSVTEVKIDGAVLDASAYHVEDYRSIVRDDGGLWPCCQHLNLADTEPGTWSVAFEYGMAPPEGGVLAAEVLACELYRGCKGGECAIPERTINLVRQGVTMQLISPQDIGMDPKTGDVRTGLFAVQLFLSAYGTKRRRRPGTIASPDIPVADRRRT